MLKLLYICDNKTKIGIMANTHTKQVTSFSEITAGFFNSTKICKENESYSGYEFEVYNKSITIGCDLEYSITYYYEDETNASDTELTLHDIDNITLLIGDYEINLTDADAQSLKSLITKKISQC